MHGPKKQNSPRVCQIAHINSPAVWSDWWHCFVVFRSTQPIAFMEVHSELPNR